MQQYGSMSFQGTLAFDDLTATTRLALRKHWFRRLFIWGFIGMAVFVVSQALWVGENARLTQLIYPVLMLGMLFGSEWNQVRLQFKQNSHFKELGTYEFDAEGLRISWPSLEVKRPRSAVVRASAGKDHYLIYVTPIQFHVVPRRFLTDEVKWRSIVERGLGRPIEKA